MAQKVEDRKLRNRYWHLNNAMPLIASPLSLPRSTFMIQKDPAITETAPAPQTDSAVGQSEQTALLKAAVASLKEELAANQKVLASLEEDGRSLRVAISSLKKELTANQKVLASLEEDRRWLGVAVEALLDEPRFLRVRVTSRPCDRAQCSCGGADHLWTAQAIVGGLDGELFVAAKVMHVDGTPHTTDVAPSIENGIELVGAARQVAWGKPVKFSPNGVSEVTFECHRDGHFLHRKSCNKPLVLQFEVLPSAAAYRKPTGEDPILKSRHIALKD